MKTSEVFFHTKDILLTTKIRYICNAVDEVTHSGAGNYAKRVIHERIHPFSTAEDWLSHAINDRFDGAWRVANEEYFKEWRLMWLDKLIEEFEAKGD